MTKPASRNVVAFPTARSRTHDPIFAAIARRRATHHAVCAAADRSDEVFVLEGRKDCAAVRKVDRQQKAASDADTEAVRAMVQTIPTTLGGLLAVASYMVECDERGHDIGQIPATDQPGDCSTVHGVFAHSIKTALERLIGST